MPQLFKLTANISYCWGHERDNVHPLFQGQNHCTEPTHTCYVIADNENEARTMAATKFQKEADHVNVSNPWLFERYVTCTLVDLSEKRILHSARIRQ